MKFVLTFLSCTVVILYCARNLATSTSSSNNGSDEIVLEDFANPLHQWQEMNDPVMGGQSTGTFTISENVGIFDGVVKDVPFLQAPGFIQARTLSTIRFPDVSHCQSLQLVLKSSHPEYRGYRVSFGTKHAPGGKFFARGFKASFILTEDDDSEQWQTVTLPFTMFTDFWDDATGDPIHTCLENELYCPDTATLQNVKTMAVWGEGVGGKVNLQLQTISAVGCASSSNEPPFQYRQ